jgi:hypothetical protein
MMVGRVILGPAVFVVCMVSGCVWPVGGPCEYAEVSGTATIVSVSDASEGENNCANDPVVVVFDFVPDDPGDEAHAATGWHLTIGGGANPPRAWVDAEGLTVGTEHPCMRSDILSGTCTPVLYTFTGVDYDAAIDACY